MEKVIVIPCEGRLNPYLVQGEPLWNESRRITGVSTTLRYLPGLVHAIDNSTAVEPRGAFHGHVLYFYEDFDKYIENILKYILDGIEYGYYVWIIENKEVSLLIDEEVKKSVEVETHKCVHYIDNEVAYGVNDSWDERYVIASLTSHIKSFVKRGVPIRIWAHVPCPEVKGFNKVTRFETIVDMTIKETGITSVCAYDAWGVPAALQTNLLRSHQYFMTDKELVYSPLYTRNRKGSFLSPLAIDAIKTN